MIEVVVEGAHLYGELKAALLALLILSLSFTLLAKLRRVYALRLSFRGLLDAFVETLSFSLRVGGAFPIVAFSLYLFHVLLIPTALLHVLMFSYVFGASVGFESPRLAELLKSFEPTASLRVLTSAISAVALSVLIWWRVRAVGFKFAHMYPALILATMVSGVAARAYVIPLEAHVIMGYAMIALTPLRMFRHFLVDVEANLLARYLPRRQGVTTLVREVELTRSR